MVSCQNLPNCTFSICCSLLYIAQTSILKKRKGTSIIITRHQNILFKLIYNFKVIYNSQSIKFNLLKHTIQRLFCILTRLCNNHHYLTAEHFHHSKEWYPLAVTDIPLQVPQNIINFQMTMYFIWSLHFKPQDLSSLRDWFSVNLRGLLLFIILFFLMRARTIQIQTLIISEMLQSQKQHLVYMCNCNNDYQIITFIKTLIPNVETLSPSWLLLIINARTGQD